jgi:hypothetical protein
MTPTEQPRLTEQELKELDDFQAEGADKRFLALSHKDLSALIAQAREANRLRAALELVASIGCYSCSDDAREALRPTAGESAERPKHEHLPECYEESSCPPAPQPVDPKSAERLREYVGPPGEREALEAVAAAAEEIMKLRRHDRVVRMIYADFHSMSQALLALNRVRGEGER